MNNNLTTLNNILFEQIERINDEDQTKEQLKETLEKANCINSIATTIVKNAHVQLKAYSEFGRPVEGNVVKLLGIEDKRE